MASRRALRTKRAKLAQCRRLRGAVERKLGRREPLVGAETSARDQHGDDKQRADRKADRPVPLGLAMLLARKKFLVGVEREHEAETIGDDEEHGEAGADAERHRYGYMKVGRSGR